MLCVAPMHVYYNITIRYISAAVRNFVGEFRVISRTDFDCSTLAGGCTNMYDVYKHIRCVCVCVCCVMHKVYVKQINDLQTIYHTYALPYYILCFIELNSLWTCSSFRF